MRGYSWLHIPAALTQLLMWLCSLNQALGGPGLDLVSSHSQGRFSYCWAVFVPEKLSWAGCDKTEGRLEAGKGELEACPGLCSSSSCVLEGKAGSLQNAWLGFICMGSPKFITVWFASEQKLERGKAVECKYPVQWENSNERSYDCLWIYLFLPLPYPLHLIL